MSCSIIERFRKLERRGERKPFQNRILKPGAAVSVVDSNVSMDLYRLIPTWGAFTDFDLYLVCDRKSEIVAKSLARTFNCLDRLKTRRWINQESIRFAESRLSNLTIQSDYWKPGPIWWKIEGLRRVIEETRKPVLMIDSDIVFCSPFNQAFHCVDAAFSPFYWSDPELLVKNQGDENCPGIYISNRDGWLNAGFALVGREEIARRWLYLYESGIGGFYEQWLMKFLHSEFKCGYFDYLHNWGSWRREEPPPNVGSIHAHAWTKPPMKWHRAIQERGNQATREACRRLTK